MASNSSKFLILRRFLQFWMNFLFLSHQLVASVSFRQFCFLGIFLCAVPETVPGPTMLWSLFFCSVFVFAHPFDSRPFVMLQNVANCCCDCHFLFIMGTSIDRCTNQAPKCENNVPLFGSGNQKVKDQSPH